VLEVAELLVVFAMQLRWKQLAIRSKLLLYCFCLLY